MHDKRKFQRERVQLAGRVTYNDGLDSVGCAIRDLSVTGARLSLLEPAGVPNQFELCVVATGDTYAVEVKWRRGRQLGVYFVERDEPDICWQAETGYDTRRLV